MICNAKKNGKIDLELILEVIVFLNVIWNFIVAFVAIHWGQQTGFLDVREANSVHATGQVEEVRVCLQKILSSGTENRIFSVVHMNCLSNSRHIPSKAHVLDVVGVTFFSAQEIFPRVASNGGEDFWVAHSHLVKVPRPEVVARLSSNFDDRRSDVNVAAGMLRTTIRVKINVTDSVFHSQKAAVGVNDLNVGAVSFRD